MNLEQLRTVMISLNQAKKDILIETELSSIADIILAKISDYAQTAFDFTSEFSYDATDPRFVEYEQKRKDILDPYCVRKDDGSVLIDENGRATLKEIPEEEVRKLEIQLGDLMKEYEDVETAIHKRNHIMYQFANTYEIPDEDIKYMLSQDVSPYTFSLKKSDVVVEENETKFDGLKIVK